MALDVNIGKNFKANFDDIDSAKANKITFIPFNKLQASELNKTIFIVDDELSESIKENGLFQSLIVKRIENDKYEVLSGNRRFTAFQKLIAEDSEFKYKFNNNSKLIDPINTGIPCTIIEKEMTPDEEKHFIMANNKTRDFDRLEIYRMVQNELEIYKNLKENNELERGSGRECEWVASNLPVSVSTVRRILDDKWLINSMNIDDIEKLGRYSKWKEQNANTSTPVAKSSSPSKKTNESIYEKEKAQLNKINSYYTDHEIDISVSQEDKDLLEEQAKDTIKSIMKVYSIHSITLK